ncbi:MAG: hypothetical protein ABJZ56_03445 [Paracoccaceae bacterium]
MYVLLIPKIAMHVSNSIYTLNTDHQDRVLERGALVSKGDGVCWMKYEYLPKMGFLGFLQDLLSKPRARDVVLRSPVDGTFETGLGGTFHDSRPREFSKPFTAKNELYEVDNPVAFRFYISEKVTVTAASFYQDFFDVFFENESWTDTGLKDGSYYDPEWRSHLERELAYFKQTVCPVVPAEGYKG